MRSVFSAYSSTPSTLMDSVQFLKSPKPKLIRPSLASQRGAGIPRAFPPRTPLDHPRFSKIAWIAHGADARERDSASLTSTTSPRPEFLACSATAADVINPHTPAMKPVRLTGNCRGGSFSYTLICENPVRAEAVRPLPGTPARLPSRPWGVIDR